MTFAIDKSTWRRVRFEDLAQSVTDRVDDPSESGVDRYVGLEHLDPGSLTITRWGHPSEVEAQKLRFAPGDVIFGRRRAYQRKVAQADFHGICSAHALVLRAKPEVVLPEFLPIFMSSEYFLDRAIKISVGSLSPTVNWRDLAAQEFLLPPLADQQSISALLWSAHSHLLHVREALLHALALQRAYRNDYLRSIETRAKASEVFDITIGRQRSPKHAQGEHMVPYLRSANVTPEGIDTEDVMMMNFTPAEQEIFRLVTGDVLVSEGSASLSAVGQPAVWEGQIDATVCFQNTLLRYRAPAGATSTDFIKHWCRWAHESGQFAAIAHGTGILHIGLKNASLMTVPIPTASEQERFVNAMAEHERTEMRLVDDEVLTRRLIATLLRDFLGE